MRRGYSVQEHTGELELRVEADTLCGLFCEAARGLAETMGGPSVRPPPFGEHQSISLEAPDRNALLFDWLNELIYLTERDNSIFHYIQIERLTEKELTASVRGYPIEEPRLQVKAATFHGLEIKQTQDGYVADIVLDV